MTREEINQIKYIIHRTIYKFFDICNDNEETPLSEKDKLLLSVNKAICNNIETLEQEPKAEWIPVNERLQSPKEDEEVLVYLRGGGMRVGYYHYEDLNEIVWYTENDDILYDEPIEWMPLPKLFNINKDKVEQLKN